MGEHTLDVIARHPDRFRVVALGAHRNAAKLAEQAARFSAPYAALADATAAAQLEARTARAWRDGPRARRPAARSRRSPRCPRSTASWRPSSGAAGLRSTLAAARAGKRLLFANKESLVMAGPLLMRTVRESGATLLPIDSEHNAVFQCLPRDARAGRRAAGRQAHPADRLRRSVPRRRRAGASRSVTPDQACAHPNWVMGRKISVDSATLMNKGLEFIEACLLFGVPAAQVEVLIHRESIVHSLVEYVDGSVLAQLGAPDMRTPIAHALAWPERVSSGVQSLDLVKVGKLRFEAPDLRRFPSLGLAQEAARAGRIATSLTQCRQRGGRGGVSRGWIELCTNSGSH